MAEGSFHSVRFPILAQLLRDLGFSEGIMAYHIYGNRETSMIIRKIFDKGHYSWPWSRSIFYALEKYGLADEGDYYVVEYRYENQTIYFYFKDHYGNMIKVYRYSWSGQENLPSPINRKRQGKYVVIGKQHIKKLNEERYFSRW